MVTWKERIKELRACGLTLEQIGAAIGLSTPAVGGLSTGRTKSPRGDAAIKLHRLHQRMSRRSAA